MDVAELTGLPDGAVGVLEGEGVRELYPPQAEAVRRGVLDGENLVASVPTASGKTLIAELAMLSAVRRGGRALYVVPLRALASEKRETFERWSAVGVDVGVSTGDYESDGEWLAAKDVIVATSEKVDSLVRNDAPWIDDLACVVADEIHLVDDPGRGPTLEVTLAKLRRRNPGLQVVALSATVANADEVADWLDAALVASDWRPIDLRTGVHYGDAINFDDGSRRRVPAEGRQTPALVADTLDGGTDDGPGGDESEGSVGGSEDGTTTGGSALVFVNSRRNAESAADRLADVTGPRLTDEERDRLREVASEIRDVSDAETSDDLADTVREGAAFHHAGLCVTGDTQILRPDGTFTEIRRIVHSDAVPGKAVGMDDLELGAIDITDTFAMGERPVLTLRTRTGNELELSRNHPLPVLRETGIEWIPAGDLESGDYLARPRRFTADIEEPPSFRELVPDQHRVFREYETVARLASDIDDEKLPSTYKATHERNRNITLGGFRKLCRQNDEHPTELFEQIICDGGHKPVRIPKQVNPDVSWLAGVVAGDGYVNDGRVVLTGRSDLLAKFDSIAMEQFDRTTSSGVSPSGTPFNQLNSKVIADIFAEHFGTPRGTSEIQLPSVPLPDEEFGAYVSGLFDADGSVSPRSNAEGAPCVEFYSTSRRLITQLKTALLRFNIIAFRDIRSVKGRVTECEGRRIRSKQNIHRLTIYGIEQLRRFRTHIGFRHSEKASKLRTAIEHNSEGGRRQNDVIPPAIGELVRETRTDQNLSMADLEPEVPKATLSRFERGKTPMKRETFQSLASVLAVESLDEIATSDVFWDRIESVERTGTRKLYDLSTNSENFVANGIIAHNTSDHRSLVEDAFRDRLVKCVCATPTLAAGVNTPSRRVIVRDWRRYDGDYGGMKPLSTLEVHQMMGRAGRPGLDPYGEAVLTAKSHDEMDDLFERYVWADPEPVRSKLAAEPALRTHLLATVASGFARSRDGLLDFLDRTLYAAQTDGQAEIERVADGALDYLARNGFLDRTDGDLEATDLGRTTSRLYLDPMSAAEIVDGLAAADDPSPLGLYHLVARTPDMYELYLKSGERETYTELCYERERELLGPTPSEFEDVRFEEWLAALKTAKLLEDWAAEVDEDRITERYGVGPGDVRGKVETAEWLLGAAERLAGEVGADPAPVRRARKRVEHGVRAELLDLVGVRGIGRKRARRLYEAGIETRADLRAADKATVLGAVRGRRGTAERVLENAGRRDPSMEGVEVGGGGPSDDGGDGGRPDRDDRTDDDRGDDEGERTGESGDQASLGDFG